MASGSVRYTKDHEWIRVDDPQSAAVGVTDHAQRELGDIVYVELPEVGDEVTRGETFGNVESVKAVSPLTMPVSGVVVAVNEALEDAPELVNQSPEGEGWMIKIKISEEAELEELLNRENYDAHVASQN